MRRAISMEDIVKRLGATGAVAMVGYVFDGGWAQRNRALLDRFFAAMRKAAEDLADLPQNGSDLPRALG